MVADYFHVHFQSNLDVLISLDHVLEVLTLSQGDICPIPGVNPELWGVVNHRGKLLWVLDFITLWGLPPGRQRWRATDKFILMVMTTQFSPGGTDQQWGGVISHLQGIATLPNHHHSIAVETNLPPLLLPFVQTMTDLEQTPMVVLDPRAVFEHLQSAIQPTVMV